MERKFGKYSGTPQRSCRNVRGAWAPSAAHVCDPPDARCCTISPALTGNERYTNMEENVKENMTDIDPESAYVKSMDYLDRVLSETALTFKNLRSYQIGCAVLSVLLGLLLMRSFGNVFGLLAPIVGMNITFLLYSRGVTKRLTLAEANAKYDIERLKQGKLDPRVFYKHIAEALTEAKKTDYLESLNGDTSSLSPKEKARLSKYYES